MLKAALPGEIIRKEGRGDVAMIMNIRLQRKWRREEVGKEDGCGRWEEGRQGGEKEEGRKKNSIKTKL